jgi:delta-aminolevulinic acid dehydratase/porphobilinogen synthase
METLMSCRRAGADIIFTYAALDVAKKLKETGEF